MFVLRSLQLPKNNPCGQCGNPIPAPVWTETDHNRIHFIWHCVACDYRFQTTAIYREEFEQIAA
jgi:hypothetical protein